MLENHRQSNRDNGPNSSYSTQQYVANAEMGQFLVGFPCNHFNGADWPANVGGTHGPMQPNGRFLAMIRLTPATNYLLHEIESSYAARELAPATPACD